MADQRITQLTELTKAGVAANDVLPIADISGSETKKVTAKNLVGAAVDLIDDSEIDLIKLDQASTTKLGTTAIADDAITYAKIQNVTNTNRLLGRSSAGAGVVEEIVCTAAGRALLDDADAAAQRITLGIDTSDSVTFGTVTANISSSNASITGGTITGITDLTVADGGTGASTAAGARTNLGLDIGNLIDGGDVQAYDAGLQSISNLLTSANQSIYTTASNTYATYTLTAAGRALLDDADAAAQRTTLGLGSLATLNTITSSEISDLTVNTADLAENSVTIAKINLNAGELAGNLIANSGITATQLGTAAVETSKIADRAVTYTKIQNTSTTNIIIGRQSAGAGGLEEITCTAAGRALIDDVTAADQRTTLGLGTLATQSGTFSGTHSGTTSGTNTGDQTITLTGDVTGTGTGTFATTLSNSSVGTDNIADDAVTYTKIQDVTATDRLLGRSTAGAGDVEEIVCTAAGRALIDDANAAAQRTTLGLGTLATQDGTFSGTHSGTSSGTNTGDQTITLTGAVTGTGTGSFATTLAADIVAATNLQVSSVTTAKINDS